MSNIDFKQALLEALNYGKKEEAEVLKESSMGAKADAFIKALKDEEFEADEIKAVVKALGTYVLEYKRSWKDELSNDMQHAYYPLLVKEDGELMQSVRNSVFDELMALTGNDIKKMVQYFG